MSVADLKLRASIRLKQFPVAFWMIASLRETAHRRLVKRDTDVVIEGSWRCANHFAVEAFTAAQPYKPNIAHHFHSPSQLLLAARWNIPAILLIREPIAAAVSFCIYRPDISPHTALSFYSGFYRPLIDHLQHFVIADFQEVTASFGDVIERVNTKFDRDFNPSIRDSEQILDKIQASGSHRPERSAAPTMFKERRKERMRCIVESRPYSLALARCQELYQWIKSCAP